MIICDSLATGNEPVECSSTGIEPLSIELCT